MAETLPDISNLSDEEFAALPFDQVMSATPPDDKPFPGESDEGSVGEIQEGGEGLSGETGDQETPANSSEGGAEERDEGVLGGESVDPDPNDEAEPGKGSEEELGKGEPAASENQIDYAAEYQRLTTPFKANGKQVQVDTVDEAITLMQMGANYHQKMVALKPARKIMKLLEHNGLLDEEKINYLIDVSNHNPDAITKLLQDSKVDPTAIDMEEESGYQPQPRTVADSEIELDDVIDSIRNTDTYPQVMNVVTKEWDDASRTIIAQHPHVLGVINQHMSNGIYDQVTSAVEKQRQLGNLTGMSDIEAYRAMGEQLTRSGQLKSATSPEPTKDGVSSPVQPEVKPQKASVQRRKKAAAVRRTPPSTGHVPVDIYSMSDEEVAALDTPPFNYV